MNIFALHANAREAARDHVDRHVVKMLTESVQMLSTAHHIHHSVLANTDRIWKPTHVKHPCTQWVAETSGNYYWTWKLALSLDSEYRHRYSKQHKSGEMLAQLHYAPQERDNDVCDTTAFAEAMPYEYIRDNAIDSYRAYYACCKSELHSYRLRETPQWWLDLREKPHYTIPAYVDFKIILRDPKINGYRRVENHKSSIVKRTKRVYLECDAFDVTTNESGSVTYLRGSRVDIHVAADKLLTLDRLPALKK